MKLILVSFADAGNLERERVILKAAEDADVGDYTILRAESNEPNTACTGSNPAFWFPNAKLKEGDLVVLYSKTGTESKKAISGGNTAYFFYWGLDKSLWGTSGVALVLIESSDWTIEWPAETVEPDAS